MVVVSESGLSFLIISRDRGIFGLSWGVEVKGAIRSGVGGLCDVGGLRDVRGVSAVSV